MYSNPTKTENNKRNKNGQARMSAGLNNLSNSESNSESNRNIQKITQPLAIENYFPRSQKASNSPSPKPGKASNSPNKKTRRRRRNSRNRGNRGNNKKQNTKKKYLNYKVTNNEGSYKQRLKKPKAFNRFTGSEIIKISEPIRNNLGNDPVLLMLKSENKNNLNELEKELNIQRELANSGLAPIVNHGYANVQSKKYEGKKIYYVQKMKTFDEITERNSNNFQYLKTLYDSLLNSVGELYLNYGYIPLDMKEENLVIDESKIKRKVLFIDTDPQFFVKIDIDEKYVSGIQLAMLLMILFNNTNMGKYGQLRRKLNLFENDPKLLNKKIEYLREFCNNDNFKGETNEDTYENIKHALNEINEKIIEYNGDESYDLQYMFFHYLLRTYRGVISDYRLKEIYYHNINYIGTILLHYVKPLLNKPTDSITENNLLNQPLQVLTK